MNCLTDQKFKQTINQGFSDSLWGGHMAEALSLMIFVTMLVGFLLLMFV